MIRRSGKFFETRRMPARRFREAEEHEYTFLLCLSCNSFKYKNDLFIEKAVKAENLAEAIDILTTLLSSKRRDTHKLDDVFEDFKDYTELPQISVYDPNSEEDFADYIRSQSLDGDIDPCYLGIMKDGKILEDCLDKYMGGYDPDFRVMYWRSIIQKMKRGTLNLEKWGHSLQNVRWALDDAIDMAERY